ncbi:MAG TPA: hypothetical protein VNR38_05065 [Ureibacillus sp.]|nr:hypothetical protein [Ureibacillus sp.]
MKKLTSLLLIFVAYSLVGYNIEVFANQFSEKSNDFTDRIVPQTFQFKYNYDELYEFLNIDEKEYKSNWESGKTISDMATEQGISHQQLILFLAEKQFLALDEALKNREIDRYFYYDYAISYMKGDIIEFINRNPNKQI